MAQLFSRSADTAFRAALAGAFALMAGVPLGALAFMRTPLATGQFASVPQPIRFSHPLHVNGLRIDCRYCHAGAERASMAGLPPTKACVPCHTDGLLRSTLFTPVRQSLSSGRPIMWQRVNRLPDFVFFNHAVHVRKGMGCETCHGPVHLMQTVYQAAPLTMEWCVDCHRAPERYLAQSETSLAGGTRAD